VDDVIAGLAGGSDAAFLRDMLTQTPSTVTNVRMHRVYTEQTGTGLH
jgi:hypothetical protein